MRVNIYAEEMTERVEIISKEIEGHTFTGLRLYLELPTTVGTDAAGNPVNAQGPFIHHKGDDDSSAVTFWGERDLRDVLRLMQAKLDDHYAGRTEPLLCSMTGTELAQLISEEIANHPLPSDAIAGIKTFLASLQVRS